MKYKIIKKKDLSALQAFALNDGDLFVRCEKDNVLYGQGEIIFKRADGAMLCPVHENEEVHYDHLSYWDSHYEIREI